MKSTNPHFDPRNDKLIGTVVYEGRTEELYEYKQDPLYVPQYSKDTKGRRGGEHRIKYVCGPLYIRVKEQA